MLHRSEPSPFESRIRLFGEQLFRDIGSEKPSAFDKRFWSTRAMGWSMQFPEFKTNLFRLVDVYPTLSSEAALAAHISDYLHDAGRKIHPIVGWLMNVKPGTLKSKLAAWVVRESILEMAKQFIAGETPEKALEALRAIRGRGLAFTVDLLGEFCVSEREAREYQQRYRDCLSVLGQHAPAWPEARPRVPGHPGEASPLCISIKLSALYSHTSVLNFDRSVSVLSARLSEIVDAARAHNGQIYIDAEDSGYNPIIYEVFRRVFSDFSHYPYPGVVLQAYGKDSEAIFDSLLELARRRGNPIAIRLVKGAYWDHETIVAEQNNWPSPLFHRKESSDAHFEHLSRRMIDNREWILPAFGSHNVRSLAHACVYAEERGLSPSDFELQMLFGMADPIADSFSKRGYLVRLYVPLGAMIPGMGYLVRRLLENTSNESFLKHTFHDREDVGRLLERPTRVHD